MARSKKHRWPSSVHSQCEAIFHGIRSFHLSKADCPDGIRSAGVWKVYRYESHRFIDYFIRHGGTDLRDTATVRQLMAGYLDEVLARYREGGRSRQTLETIMAALAKLEYAMNSYNNAHHFDTEKMDTKDIRSTVATQGRKLLPRSSRTFASRAYPDPPALIAAVTDGACQLMACLQFEGGLRCEGAGSPSGELLNPLTQDSLRGTSTDPVTGRPVGIVSVIEKGGKATTHYISLETYDRLTRHIVNHGKLEAPYDYYLHAINTAAKATGQYEPGRGTHGLKHAFALERYHECVQRGLSHEEALQAVTADKGWTHPAPESEPT